MKAVVSAVAVVVVVPPVPSVETETPLIVIAYVVAAS